MPFLFCLLGWKPLSMAQTQGVFLQGAQLKTVSIPDYEDISQPPGTPTTIVEIGFRDTVAAVSRYIFGTNANLYSGNLNREARLVEYVRMLRPGIVRYPGGLHSDEYFWNVEWDWGLRKPDGSAGGWFRNLPADLPSKVIKSGKAEPAEGLWYPGKGHWSFGLDDYYDFLEKTGTEGLITVNYGYARYGTGPEPVKTAAHLAAEWVRYDKGRTRYWEIGNENLYNWSGSYQIATETNRDGQPELISPRLYGEHCRVFIDSMRKAARENGTTIYIGVQSEAGVLEGVGDKADWYVDHSYYTNYQENSTVQTILHSAGAETRKYAEKTVAESVRWGVPLKALAMTEWNIFAEGSRQASSFVNGIHTVLVMGEMLRNKYGMANRWNLANAWAGGNDHGMFSQGDDPDGPTAKWNPRAPFYYAYYFQKYTGDHLVNTKQLVGNGDIVVYASVFGSGESGVIIVNKGAASQVVGLEIPGFGPVERYYLHSLTGGRDNGDFSPQVFVNGKGPTHTAMGGPIGILEEIKAWSAPVYSGIRVNSPPRSVQFVLLKKGENAVLGVEPPVAGTTCYPNPSLGEVFIGNDPGFTEYKWFDSSGRQAGGGRVEAGHPTRIPVPEKLKPGLAILHLVGQTGVEVHKIVVL